MKTFFILHTTICIIYCAIISFVIAAMSDSGIKPWLPNLPEFFGYSYIYLITISSPVYLIGMFARREFDKRFKKI